MHDKDRAIDAFLARTGHAGWARHPIAADASARRYLRLVDRHRTAILMDVPPEGAEQMAAFLRIARILAQAGLCPPDILDVSETDGLVLLSDLGRHDVAGWLQARPADALDVYRASVDVVVHLARIAPPDLPHLTPALAGDMVAITGSHYARRSLPALTTLVTDTMAQLAPCADTLALRDYHAENLIWRQDETGLARIGLLDFQDAFIAPAGYDLVSLLGDARRDVAPGLRCEMVARYRAATDAGPDFEAQLACLGAQRNLRILGVFARLAIEANKPQYLRLMPRVWRNLQEDLAHPALSALRAAVADLLPAPDPSYLATFQA